MCRDLAQDLPLGFRENDVIPEGCRLDPLRQTVKTAARVTTADLPQVRARLRPVRKISRAQFRANSSNALCLEVKLRCNLLDAAVQLCRDRPKRRAPARILLGERWPAHLKLDDGSPAIWQWFTSSDHKRAADALDQCSCSVAVVRAVAIDQQYRPAQERFAFPQADQGFPLGGCRGNVDATHGLQ